MGAGTGWTVALALLAAATAGGCASNPARDEAGGRAEQNVTTTFANADYSDANGWNQPQYYETIRYPDINGDGATDICGRGGGGIWCAVDDGKGHYVNDALLAPAFSDANGWAAPQYYSTIDFPDLDGDGKADVCGRGGGGVWCALSSGTTFGAPTLWNGSYSDANGWAQVQYYSTLQFPDVNGDGKADVCGRGAAGIWCALSDGTSFGATTNWIANFTDGFGWGQPQYYSTIRFADVNGDGKADVCGRGGGGVWCALSNGSSFDAATLWQSDYSDANGWNQPPYYQTIQFSDINGDGKADVCGRGGGGIRCALSSGTGFGSNDIWEPSFSDANGWAQPQYYQTIHIVQGTLCARGGAGILCAYSNGANAFTVHHLESANESDANGWTGAPYYRTIRLTSDFKVAERGGAGIWSGLVAEDNLSIATAAQADARRAALVQKVWGTPAIDTAQGVDTDTAPTVIDVSPLPAGVTVREYRITMPTSGGVPISGGPAAVVGFATHYLPATPTAKLAIVNPGHTCHYNSNPNQDNQAVIDLLNDGYAVLATYMPYYNPVQCGLSHDQLFDPASNFRPAGGAHPLIYFLDTVRRGLNYAIAHYGYTEIKMAGLSGGGWTTTLYAALDARITTGVPIAGSEPFTLRNPSDAEQEDVPSRGNDFFRFFRNGHQLVTGYKDLFVLGGYGVSRRLVQVLNRNDDCCFGQNEFKGDNAAEWDRSARAYEIEIREVLKAIGGSYRLEINEADDPGFAKHEFSSNTRMSGILTEFDGKLGIVGATPAGQLLARGAGSHLWWRNAATGVWMDTGLVAIGTPSVVSGAIAGHVHDVFYRDPSNHPVHAYFDGASWIATLDITGLSIDDPAAVSWGPGRIDVAALGTDYKLYHWRYDGAWHPFEAVSTTAQAVGPLTLTTWGPGRLDILFRGLDGGLYHVRSNGAPPFTVESTGMAIRSLPTALTSPGVLQAFIIGTDDRLYLGQQVNDGAWSWNNLSVTAGASFTPVLGSPSATVTPDGAFHVYARLPGGLGHFRWTSVAGWSFDDLVAPPAPPIEGSPVATTLGAFVVSPGSHSLSLFDSAGWHALGGYLDR
jgi:hypothetical protein